MLINGKTAPVMVGAMEYTKDEIVIMEVRSWELGLIR